MKDKDRLVIAVDGFSSCGKSTFAKLIAKQLGLLYIDSGAMYRAVTLYGIKQGFVTDSNLDQDELVKKMNNIKIAFQVEQGKNTTFLNGVNVEREIRDVEVANHVSGVSQIPEVREKLVSMQRSFSVKQGVVMDGRDIGTVVFPHADIKIYMTASVKVRADRRYKELKEKGMPADYDKVYQNIENRDHLDMSRELSPLQKASDAIELDNSNMTIDEQLDWFNKTFSALMDT